MIPFLAFLLLAKPTAPADAMTCPGGPIFGFVRGSDRLDRDAALDTSIAYLRAPLWRSGWITISPVVAGPIDEQALRLAKRRELTIKRRLRGRGVKGDRIRFEAVRSALPGEADAYSSTVSTPKAVWDAHVTPGILC